MVKKIEKIRIQKVVNLDELYDIKDIQKKDSFEHAYYMDDERIRRLLAKGEIFWIAYSGDGAIGFISANFDTRVRIRFLAVVERYQGYGVASRLLEGVTEEARKKELGLAYIVVEKSSKKLIEFLQKNGFKESGFHKDRFEPGRDALIYNLKL